VFRFSWEWGEREVTFDVDSWYHSTKKDCNGMRGDSRVCSSSSVAKNINTAASRVKSKVRTIKVNRRFFPLFTRRACPLFARLYESSMLATSSSQ
jgi:hypothetical protein